VGERASCSTDKPNWLSHTLVRPGGDRVDTVYLWNVADPIAARAAAPPLMGPLRPGVHSPAFSADGYTLAGGSQDGRRFPWDTPEPA